jgi:iron-sulfur cluster assembly protein
MMTLTPAAVERIRELQGKEGKPDAGLKIRIIAGGCSGMQYRMDLVDVPKPKDKVIEQDGVKVFVDPRSMVYLLGTELDYNGNLFGAGFRVQNPNAKHSCSCGLSFTI